MLDALRRLLALTGSFPQSPRMSGAAFVLSTGRCATQFLTCALIETEPGAVVEHEGLAGFRGRFRLEELFGAEAATPAIPPVEKVHTVLRDPIAVGNAELMAEVIALAGQLGYDEGRLAAGFDPDALARRYRAARLPVPLWPTRT